MIFFRFFYLFLFLAFLAHSSLQEGIDFFNKGDYEKARAILGQESFDENWRARLYLLASQGFEPKARSEELLSALKLHLRRASSNGEHSEDIIVAKLVEAFWNLYSEQTVRLPGDVFRRLGGLDLRMLLFQTERQASPHAAAAEEEHLLASHDTESYHTIDLEPQSPSNSFPPLGAGLEEVTPDEIVRYIHRAQHFPVPTLFEGRPSEQVGIRILQDLAKGSNPHALYFLGAFFLTSDEGGGTTVAKNKTMGLGCMMAAANLGNVSAFILSKQILNINNPDSCAENCAVWCCSGAEKEVPCLGCGGDTTGKWWRCGLGLFGFKTRWNAAQLFSSVRNVSRTTLENLAMLAGMGFIFVQQLEDLGVIDPIFGENKPVSGIVGLLMSGGAFGAARIGN